MGPTTSDLLANILSDLLNPLQAIPGRNIMHMWKKHNDFLQRGEPSIGQAGLGLYGKVYGHKFTLLLHSIGFGYDIVSNVPVHCRYTVRDRHVYSTPKKSSPCQKIVSTR